jgi:hypothetical protein
MLSWQCEIYLCDDNERGYFMNELSAILVLFLLFGLRFLVPFFVTCGVSRLMNRLAGARQ